MRDYKFAILLGAVLICTCAYTLWAYWHSSDRAVRVEVIGSFHEALSEEAELMQSKVVYYSDEDTYASSDSIVLQSEKGRFSFQKLKVVDEMSIQKRREWGFQLYLLHKNPNRASFIDSLFQSRLNKKAIEAQTAVSLFQGDSLINCSNAELCQPRYELTAISFGAGNGKITLKSYASFPIGYLLSRTYHVWIILAIWIAAIALLLYVYRKKKPIAILSISFNSQSGLLKKGEREIHLKQNRLLIFRALWEASEHVCNYEELCRLLGRPLRMDKDENRSIKASLKQTVQLLKGDLKEFPELEIVNLRGVGYQLLFKQSA